MPWARHQPRLCANFIRIVPGKRLTTKPNATSELYHVIRGRGRTGVHGQEIPWEKGDFFVLPAGCEAAHHAEDDAAFYWVHDEPLLTIPGCQGRRAPVQADALPEGPGPRRTPRGRRGPGGQEEEPRQRIARQQNFNQTRTITHVLWAMFGVLPADTVQLPHRHESVALDYIIECEPGCYSLIGDGLDDKGNVKNAKRADWSPGSAFVTPPGLWHSHHNESGKPAHLMPIQDAGLHTYLRTLDIHFFHKEHQSYISQK